MIDIANIPRSELPALIAAAVARLSAESVLAVPIVPEPETWVSVQEAAAKIGRSPRWFYRNARRLPFVKRLSRKVLLVGEKGMGRWIATMKA